MPNIPGLTHLNCQLAFPRVLAVHEDTDLYKQAAGAVWPGIYRIVRRESGWLPPSTPLTPESPGRFQRIPMKPAQKFRCISHAEYKFSLDRWGRIWHPEGIQGAWRLGHPQRVGQARELYIHSAPHGCYYSFALFVACPLVGAFFIYSRFGGLSFGVPGRARRGGPRRNVHANSGRRR